jgi:hypothetical protein
MYLSEYQSIIELVSDLSGRPPVVKFSIDSLLEEGALETTSSQLSFDSSVNSDVVSRIPSGLTYDLPVPYSGYTSHKVGLDQLGIVKESQGISSCVSDCSSTVHD